MGRHDELDNLILGLIDGSDPMSWSAIHFSAYSERPELYDGRLEGKEWRLTDSRLQALRKMGLIVSRRVKGGSVWSRS